MAVDRDLISEHVTLGVTPAYTFVAKGITGYNPPAYEWSEWPRERQLAYARALFTHSGYSEKKPLHLTLYFNSGESIQRIMIAIAASWKQNLPGVFTDLVSDEFRVFLAGRKDRSRWDVCQFGLVRGLQRSRELPRSFFEEQSERPGLHEFRIQQSYRRRPNRAKARSANFVTAKI